MRSQGLAGLHDQKADNTISDHVVHCELALLVIIIIIIFIIFFIIIIIMCMRYLRLRK
jgi:heme/copper-type cytochrome/quinol oxidase subunit 2